MRAGGPGQLLTGLRTRTSPRPSVIGRLYVPLHASLLLLRYLRRPRGISTFAYILYGRGLCAGQRSRASHRVLPHGRRRNNIINTVYYRDAFRTHTAIRGGGGGLIITTIFYTAHRGVIPPKGRGAVRRAVFVVIKYYYIYRRNAQGILVTVVVSLFFL